MRSKYKRAKKEKRWIWTMRIRWKNFTVSVKQRKKDYEGGRR